MICARQEAHLSRNYFQSGVMRALLLILGCVLCLREIRAQEVFSVTWPTRHASPPPALPQATSDFLPAFRAGLSFLPESSVAVLMLSQPSVLGISEQDATNLQSLFAERYRVIQNDPVFRGVASAL